MYSFENDTGISTYLENLNENLQRDISREHQLINEKSYILDKSHQVSTGFSFARGCYPVVKTSHLRKKIAVQLTDSEWNTFWESQRSNIKSHWIRGSCAVKHTENDKENDDEERINQREEHWISDQLKISYECIRQDTKCRRKVICFEARGVILKLTGTAIRELESLERRLIQIRL